MVGTLDGEVEVDATKEGVMGFRAREGESRRFLAEGVSFVGSIPSVRITVVGLSGGKSIRV